MVVFAILATVAAIIVSLLTILANGMTTAATTKGLGLIVAAWFIALVLWVALFFN